MRHIGLVVLCSVVISFVLTIGIFGQGKAITKEKYESATKDAYSKVNIMLRREVREETKYKSGKIESTETLTKEYYPNGDGRWNLVRKRDGQIFDKLQLIYLGKYEYRKEGETEWKKRCIKDCSTAESGGGMGFGGQELPKVEEYLAYETTILGQAATLYVFFRVYQFQTVLNF